MKFKLDYKQRETIQQGFNITFYTNVGTLHAFCEDDKSILEFSEQLYNLKTTGKKMVIESQKFMDMFDEVQKVEEDTIIIGSYEIVYRSGNNIYELSVAEDNRTPVIDKNIIDSLTDGINDYANKDVMTTMFLNQANQLLNESKENNLYKVATKPMKEYLEKHFKKD